MGKIHSHFVKHAAYLSSVRDANIQKDLDNSYFPIQLLEFVRLFCENQHSDMQNYIRYQPNSKRQSDLVEAILNMLLSCKVSPFTITTMEKAYECLTEFCQGPCRNNQEHISTNSFIEFTMNLFRQNTHTKEARKNNVLSSQKSQVGMEHLGAEQRHEMPVLLDSMIERLRFRSLVALMAVLERVEPQSQIIDRLKKTVPISVLIENLVRIHHNFKSIYGKSYVKESFGWAFKEYNKQIDDKYYACIIENGFYIYLFAKTIVDSVREEEEERYVRHTVLRGDIEMCDDKQRYNMKHLEKMSRMKKNGAGQDSSVFEEGVEQLKAKERVRKALKFFKLKVLNIDIVRDRKLEKVYFPKLPLCFNLPKKVGYSENRRDKSSQRPWTGSL